MSNGLVDLRSDTVTKPSDGMRKAMADAEVGDDVYDEDPTCHALEARAAELLGKEAALFTVTGSLANLLGVRTLVKPGEELLCESTAHVARAELGAHAAITGVTFRTWTGHRGQIELDAISNLLAPDAGPYFVSTKAVSVENTHNFGGGSVQSYDSMRKLREITASAGVGMHIDGARLWNASVASGVRLDEYAGLADIVSVCLSKGLGAPVGSLLAGSREAIAESRIWRKRLGGGWRQAGVLAAAGLYALEHHLDRLAEDHANARELATRLAEAVPGIVDPSEVDTNILVLELGPAGKKAADVIGAAKAEGVLVGGLGPSSLRLVTHLDVDAGDCKRAADVLVGALAL